MMNYGWSISDGSAAPGEPVTVAQAKQQANIDHDQDDTFLEQVIIPAARARAERYLSRIIVQREVSVTFDDFERWRRGSILYLPVAPVIEVRAITYLDEDEVEQDLPSTVWRADVRNVPARVFPRTLQEWPAITQGPGAVTVHLLAGYPRVDTSVGSPSTYDYGANVPPDIRHAILMDCAHLYNHRDSVADFSALTETPLGWERSLQPHRLMGLP